MRAIGRKAYTIQEMKRLCPELITLEDERFFQRAYHILTKYADRKIVYMTTAKLP